MASPVDEESRCPIDSAADATHEVASYPSLELSIFKRLAQCRGSELQLLGKSQEGVAAQALLVLIQEIMHLPEFPVGARELSGLGSGFSMRMQLTQGKVPENQPEPLPKMLLHALDDGIRPTAMRAFIVAVLHEGYFRAIRALGVIFRRHGYFEHGHKSFLFRQILERLQDAVRAGIHGNRRAVAPRDDSALINYKKRSLANAFGGPVGTVLAGDCSFGLKIRE